MNAEYRVLIIDDEELIREGLRSCIDWSQTGFTIVGEASSGAEALRLVDEYPFDLIITDLMMPDMSGLDCIQAIKAKHPDLPFIIISGIDRFEFAQKAMELHVLGYLLKPVSPQKLLSLLQQCKNILTQRDALALEHNRTRLNRAIAHESHSEHEVIEAPGGNFYLLLVLSNQCKSLPLAWLEQTTANLLRSQQLDADNIVAFDVPRYPHIYGAIFHSNNMSMHNYHCLASQLYQKIQAPVDDNPFLTPCCIGVTYPFISSKSVFSAFQQAIKNLRMRPFLKSNTYSETVLARKTPPEFKNKLSAANDSIRYFLQVRKFADAKSYICNILHDDNAIYFTPSAANSFITLLCGHLSLLIALYDFTELSKEIERLQSPVYLVYFSSIAEWRNDILGIIDHIELCFSRYSQDDIIGQIQNYLAKNYSADWDLSELAALFYVNPSYLSHLFKKKTGKTLTTYIEDLRIENACTLLKNSDLSISEVASTVGYSDPNYFTKRFRKKIGVAPVAYRENNGNKSTQTSSDS